MQPDPQPPIDPTNEAEQGQEDEPERDGNRRRPALVGRRRRPRPRPRRRSRRSYLWEGLVLLLTFVAFLLGSTLLMLRQQIVIKRRIKAKRVADAALSSLAKEDEDGHPNKKKSRRKTAKPFEPHTADEIHLRRRTEPYYLNQHRNRNASLRDHYWRIAKLQLSSWDPTWDDDERESASSAKDLLEGVVATSSGATAKGKTGGEVEATNHPLRRAAELGHPDAQFYASVAHWSGVWPVPSSSMHESSKSTPRNESTVVGVEWLTKGPLLLRPAQFYLARLIASTTTIADKRQLSRNLANDGDRLKVMEEGWSATHPQHAQALLYLHMAAMAGHEEAIIALANKMEHHQSALTSSNQEASQGSLSSCQMRLPYAEAASDVIMDRLQASPSMGRGKITPPADRHVLYQLHLHGSSSGAGGGAGASNKYLEPHNQPDETRAALQFYEVRAGTRDDPAAAPAAYTLAHLHHTGARGVPVNLTLALHWYQVAAELGNVEAAGQVGDFYLYGFGAGDVGSTMPAGGDPYQAYKWYERGLLYSIDSCRRRWEIKLAKKDTNTCDPTCLNGMGVLLMVGVPMMVAPDVSLADQYFELAKEQGKLDAAYNLAMMRLGWKSHWRTRDDAEDVEREYEAREEKDKKKFAAAKESDGIFPVLNQGMPKYSLTRSEWQAIVTDLSMAASAGHVQARHRLGKLYSTGVRIEIARSSGQSATEQVIVVPQDCEKAYKNFKWLMDNASLHRTRRLRKAYKQFVSGALDESLRNYLVAAETGSDLAQLNAAFLLEQGACLGLSDVDCAKAAVRLYKSAAVRGHAEASLRVGDFYYYGRFRDDGKPSGPFGWLQYLLYPERYVDRLLYWMNERLMELATMLQGLLDSDAVALSSTPKSGECSAEDGTCSWLDKERTKSSAEAISKGGDDDHSVEHDMEMAAHYYKFAADKSQSIRANFNLGFLYQWGLGLKQDFPLAKRHYDLAMSSPVPRASDLPVSIALHSLALHERALKLYRSYQEWKSELEMASALSQLGSIEDGSSGSDPADSSVPMAAESKEEGRPVPPAAPTGSTATGSNADASVNPTLRERQLEIILRHLLSVESLVIVILTAILWALMQRRTRRRR